MTLLSDENFTDGSGGRSRSPGGIAFVRASARIKPVGTYLKHFLLSSNIAQRAPKCFDAVVRSSASTASNMGAQSIKMIGHGSASACGSVFGIPSAICRNGIPRENCMPSHPATASE